VGLDTCAGSWADAIVNQEIMTISPISLLVAAMCVPVQGRHHQKGCYAVLGLAYQALISSIHIHALHQTPTTLVRN